MKPVLHKVQNAVPNQGWKAVIAMSPENFRYLSHTYVPSQNLIRRRHHCAIVPATGNPTLVVVDVEEGFVRGTSVVPDIRSYNQFTSSAAAATASVLEEQGIVSGSVGIELDFIPVSEMAILQKALPDVTFVDARAFFLECRRIKSAHELAVLTDVNRIAEQIHSEVFSSLEPGMTEKHIEKRILDRLLELGADKAVLITVASGPRSSLLNGSATSRALERGDIVRIDMSGIKEGYFSDICRTGVLGKASPEHLRVWDTLVESRRMIAGRLGPGVDTREIYAAYREYVTSRGIRPIDFVGHGIGLTIHEEPYIGRYNSSVLEPGMVMCIEPLYVEEGKYAFQLEDLVTITNDGFAYLTGGEKSERLLEALQ